MFDHEIKRIVDTAAVAIAARLLRPFRAVIRQELFVMSDAIDRQAAQTDAALRDLRDQIKLQSPSGPSAGGRKQSPAPEPAPDGDAPAAF